MALTKVPTKGRLVFERGNGRVRDRARRCVMPLRDDWSSGVHVMVGHGTISSASWLLVLLFSVGLGSCAGPFIQRHTVLKSAPPYQGTVEVRLAPRRSTGQVLFQTEVVVQDTESFINHDEFMRMMRRRAARLGANVLVVRCERRPAIGSTTCLLTGYRE